MNIQYNTTGDELLEIITEFVMRKYLITYTDNTGKVCSETLPTRKGKHLFFSQDGIITIEVA